MPVTSCGGENLVDTDLLNTIRALPKIELHRHLEGSVRLQTLIDVALEYGIEMPEYDVETLRPFVQMMPDEARNWQHFLAKFQTLRQFFRSPDVIRRVTREVVEDAAVDNVKYLELRFTPRALSNIINCTYHDVVSWVCETAIQAGQDFDIQVRLILSMNRHESVEIGEEVLSAAIDHCDQGVVAVDLAGDEQTYSARPFLPVFERARGAGLGITIHAGEWGGADNVRDAIEHLGAARIGHGVRLLEDPTLAPLLAEREVVLEVCPTSNVQSGVVADFRAHPLPLLLREQVRATINTDDPLVSNITLSDEIERVVTHMDMTLEDVKQLTVSAAQAAFLPEPERMALVARFEGWFSSDTAPAIQ
jgi:adenosine deaminase